MFDEKDLIPEENMPESPKTEIASDEPQPDMLREQVVSAETAPETELSEEECREKPNAEPTSCTVKQTVVRAKTLLKENRSAFREFFTLGILAAAIGILIYYISGPALAFFHADCSDSLLWAQITVESGEILSEDFHYAGILPFGAPIWMVPVLKLFGYTMTSQIISMSIFAIVFVLSAYSMFRALKLGSAASAGCAFVISFLLSGSVKMREIMWGHVIYYSLGILLFMWFLNLALRLTEYMKQWLRGLRGWQFYLKFAGLAVALLLLSVGTATDGFQVLALSALPVMAACVAVAVLDGESRFCTARKGGQYLLVVTMAVGIFVGLKLLNVFTHDGKINAGYADAYSNWAGLSSWWGHIEQFLQQYLSVFGLDIRAGSPLFSVDSVFKLLQLVAAMIILICPWLLLARYRKLKRMPAKLTAWAYCFLAAVILLGFICGSLSAANWRLIPLIGCGIVSTLVYLRELWDDKAFGRRMAAILAAVLIVTTAYHTVNIVKLPNEPGDNQKYITITDNLYQRGHTRGYATFWHAANAHLFSEGKVDVITVSADENGVNPVYYQSYDPWVLDQQGRKTYFLMLTEDEYTKVIASPYWTELNERHDLLEETQSNGFRILIFDGNPIF